MHIKSYSESINEGIRDKMTPKSTDDIKQVIGKLPPYKALSKAYEFELPELIKLGWERVKPINDKLYQASKKFNRNNIDKFMDFICTWIDEQGGNSRDVQEVFESISWKLGISEEDEEEYEDDEELDEFDHPLPTTQKTEDTIYSDNTIKLYKQLVISYAIDEVSHNAYEEEEDDWEDDGGWEEEQGGGMMHEEEEDEDAYYDRLTSEMEEKLKEEEEEELKKKKEEEEKKPINKIKKFLGFNNDNKTE